MPKHIIFVIALFLLTLALVALAVDDPFTGAWQEVRPSEPSQMMLTPVGDGLTFQKTGEKPFTLRWGKDFFLELNNIFANIVRVDDHSLKTTYSYSQGGNIVRIDTGTVSSDGIHYTVLAEFPPTNRKSRMEYDRVGQAPAGDAFFGTWKFVRQEPAYKPTTYTFKVDNEIFDMTLGNFHVLTAHFDGKEHQGNGLMTSSRVTRIDPHTISVVTSLLPSAKPSNGSIPARFKGEEKVLWRVEGDRLTRTETRTGDDQSAVSQGKPEITEFERVK